MGKALEVISGQATAPGVVITALAMGAGNSNVVRSVPEDQNPLLLAMWAQSQVAGIVRVMSPRMANNNQGIHIDTVIGNTDPLIPFSTYQKLYSQDTLTLGISGSGVGGQLEGAGFLIYYPDLPGANANFISLEELKTRAINIMSNRNVLVLGAGGGYTGQVVITATENMFKANVDYALLGYEVQTACCTVRMIASDFGNLGIGGPGNQANKALTRRWFISLSEQTGLDLIPVINASNVPGILVDAMQNQAAANTNVAWIFAELS